MNDMDINKFLLKFGYGENSDWKIFIQSIIAITAYPLCFFHMIITLPPNIMCQLDFGALYIIGKYLCCLLTVAATIFCKGKDYLEDFVFKYENSKI